MNKKMLALDNYSSYKNLGPAIEVECHTTKEGIVEVKLNLSDTPGLKWKIIGVTSWEAKINEWMRAYVEKKKLPKIPLVLKYETFFTQQVLDELSNIPLKGLLSYSEVAAKIGKPKAFRAVGSACGRNPCPLFIPCHRVIASNGALGGFSSPMELKIRLLNFEAS